MRNLQPATQYITPHLAISSIHYLKVTIICSYIFLRFWDLGILLVLNFAILNTCTMYTMSLYRKAIIIDKYVRVTSQQQ